MLKQVLALIAVFGVAQLAAVDTTAATVEVKDGKPADAAKDAPAAPADAAKDAPAVPADADAAKKDEAKK